MWSKDAKTKSSDEDSEEDSEEEESEEESDDGGAGPSAAAGGASAAELSREERKAEKKARKEAAIARTKKPVEVGDLPPSDSDEDEDDADMPANPNHSRKARNQTKVPATVKEATEAVEKLSVAPGAPSRREREAMEAAAAKERYRKLHEAGKTDEAKADLARLKLIREKREAEAARKQVCLFQPPLVTVTETDTIAGREGGEGGPGQGEACRDRGQGSQAARGGDGAQEDGEEEMNLVHLVR